jgi:hypothetical protein
MQFEASPCLPHQKQRASLSKQYEKTNLNQRNRFFLLLLLFNSNHISYIKSILKALLVKYGNRRSPAGYISFGLAVFEL